MGTVYLGEHPLIGRQVAIKVLHKEFSENAEIVQRFFHEAKAANDIKHENIVDILDFGQLEVEGQTVVYLIMELLDGESLAARVRRGPLPSEVALSIIRQCCSALAASHAKGVIHRDLKPDNIHLCPRSWEPNFVKLLDFGVAKLIGDPAARKTRVGTVLGTPAYMSPEQCHGTADLDGRADVYSLGMVLYELLTGQVPFGGSYGEVILAHLTQDPSAPSSIVSSLPPETDALVMRAIEKEPGRRFQDMNAFSRALVEPLAHLDEYAAMPPARRLASGGTLVIEDDGPPAPVSERLTVLQAPENATVSGGSASQAGQSSSGRRPTPTPAGTHAPTPVPSTTLAQAASEMVGPRPTRNSRWPLLAVALLLVAAAGTGGVLFLRPRPIAVVTPPPTPTPPLPAPPEPTPPPPVLPPVPEEVTVTLVSEPAGATVVRTSDDSTLGVTPLTLKLPRNQPAFDVELRLARHRTTTRSVASDISREISLVLVADRRPATTSTTPTKKSAATPPDTTPTTKPARPLIDPYALPPAEK